MTARTARCVPAPLAEPAETGHNGAVRSLLLGLVVVLSVVAVGCGPTRSSMAGLDEMRLRATRFATTGDAIVVERGDPMGSAMVLNEAYLDGDRIVLGALVTSSGNAAQRTDCVDVSALRPTEGWEDRIYWRAPNGSLAHVDGVVRAAPDECD